MVIIPIALVYITIVWGFNISLKDVESHTYYASQKNNQQIKRK
jgi:hypothetical protein